MNRVLGLGEPFQRILDPSFAVAAEFVSNLAGEMHGRSAMFVGSEYFLEAIQLVVGKALQPRL